MLLTTPRWTHCRHAVVTGTSRNFTHPSHRPQSTTSRPLLSSLFERTHCCTLIAVRVVAAIPPVVVAVTVLVAAVAA
eukprot:4352758-Prymnesium_polylepis.1